MGQRDDDPYKPPQSNDFPSGRISGYVGGVVVAGMTIVAMLAYGMMPGPAEVAILLILAVLVSSVIARGVFGSR